MLMLAALLLNLVGFANYAAVLPDLRATTGLTEVQAGLAGGAFFLAYAIGSPVFAGLTDTRDARRLYLLGTGLGVTGGLLFPWVDDGFGALLTARILTGLGMAGTYMPGLRLLIETLPPAGQQKAAGDYVSGLTLGLSTSFAVSGSLQWLFGWPAAFLGAAVAAAIAGMLVGNAMPSPPRSTARPGGLFGRLRQAARGPGRGLVLVAAFGNSWEGMAFRTWLVALLGFSVSLPGNEAYGALNFALVTAIIGPVAMPISALVARRAEAGRRHRVIACAASSAVVVGVVLAAAMASPLPVVLMLSIVYACAIFSDAGALTPAMLVRVAPAERGAALALVSAAGNLAAFASTIAFGLVLHLAGGAASADAWRIAILTTAAGSAVTAVAMFRLDRRAAA
ncbi:MFS transporter [Paracraurococcus ruber]|nr:MFS transporter [Paracraurococcus ruber]